MAYAAQLDQVTRQRVTMVAHFCRELVGKQPKFKVHMGFEFDEIKFVDRGGKRIWLCSAKDFFEETGPYSGRSQQLLELMGLPYAVESRKWKRVRLSLQASDTHINTLELVQMKYYK